MVNKKVVRIGILLIILLLSSCAEKSWDSVVLPDKCNVSSFSPHLNWVTYVCDDILWLASLPSLEDATPIVRQGDDSISWKWIDAWVPDETGFLLESSERSGDSRGSDILWLVKLKDLHTRTPIATLPGGQRIINWSPTGTAIMSLNLGAFGGDVTLIRVDGDGHKDLPIPGYIMGTPTASWSPDGQKIAYIYVPYSQDLAGAELRTIDITTYQTMTVYAGAGIPAWFPDGKKIALFGGYDSFLVVQADGSGLVEQVRLPDRYTTDVSNGATWSSDGSRLAFYLKAKIPTHESVAIGVLDRDTLGVSVTEVSGFSVILGWTPDGNAVVVLRREGEKDVLRKISIPQ